MKTTAPSEPRTTVNKKMRTGVGSSVAVTEHKETDQIILTLAQIKVERLQPKNRDIFSCERSDTLPVVFKKLVENNVLSIPVLTQKGEYYGVIDIFDIVRYVTEMFQDVTNTSMIDLERIFASDAKFSHTLASDVMQWPLQKVNPFHPITKGYSLFAAWETLSLSGARRVPVVDATGKVVDLVTQSMMIDFLWQNIEKIGKLAEKKVSEIQILRNQSVLQLPSSSKAIMAFREMVKHEVDHVAVVDSKGRLVDNLSLRDLRGVRPDVKVFYRLWNSISDYKAKLREEFPEKTPAGLIHVLPTDTLYTVVELMAVKHIHHVFVVDSAENMTPVKVISQSDIMREILGK